MIGSMFFLVTLTEAAGRVEVQLNLTNAYFSPSRKYHEDWDGSCLPEYAVDGDAPPNHYNNYSAYGSLWKYYNSNQAGPCNGAAEGLRGDSLHLEIEEAVAAVSRFDAWPGIGHWLEEPFFKLSQLHVCENANYTVCVTCKRKTYKKCKKKLDCAPNGYPYIANGRAPVWFKCKKRKTKGRYVKVFVPDTPGTTDWPKFGLIEITGFGFVKRNPPKVCQCENGRGATGKDCPSAESFKCSNCGEGYYLEKHKCVENQCSCDRGTGASHFDCPKHNEPKCIACNAGSYLLGETCMVANQCLLRMYQSLSQEDLYLDVEWVDGHILVSPSESGGLRMAKFGDLKIDSYTVETGFLGRDYRFDINANIGWVPINKTCGVSPWQPGYCGDSKNFKGTDYYHNKNSGIGRHVRDKWKFEGKEINIKDGRNWYIDRWVVKSTIERREYVDGVFPKISIEFEDGLVDTFYAIRYRHRFKWIKWDELVPAISLNKIDGNDIWMKVIDAECH